MNYKYKEQLGIETLRIVEAIAGEWLERYRYPLST